MAARPQLLWTVSLRSGVFHVIFSLISCFRISRYSLKVLMYASEFITTADSQILVTWNLSKGNGWNSYREATVKKCGSTICLWTSSLGFIKSFWRKGVCLVLNMSTFFLEGEKDVEFSPMILKVVFCSVFSCRIQLQDSSCMAAAESLRFVNTTLVPELWRTTAAQQNSWSNQLYNLAQSVRLRVCSSASACVCVFFIDSRLISVVKSCRWVL